MSKARRVRYPNATTEIRGGSKEVRRYIEALKSDKENQFAMYVLLTMATGYRYSDIKKITISMVHSGVIELTEEKTGKFSRKVLSPNLRDEIIALNLKANIADDMPVLRSPSNGIYSISRINQLLKLHKQRYDIDCPKFGTHSLRKSSCWTAFESNGSDERALFILSDSLNHSSLEQTRTYLNMPQKNIDQFTSNINL